MENLHIKLYMGKEKVLDQKPIEWVELPTCQSNQEASHSMTMALLPDRWPTEDGAELPPSDLGPPLPPQPGPCPTK